MGKTRPVQKYTPLSNLGHLINIEHSINYPLILLPLYKSRLQYYAHQKYTPYVLLINKIPPCIKLDD